MKIKVEKKKFDKFIRQFTTKGRLRRAANEKSHVNFALIEAKDGIIKFSGRKKNSKIMVRGNLEGEILEDGEFQMSDIDSFMGELKGLSGKFYEFTFGENIKVKCGKSYDFPFHISPADAALLTKLKSWDESHYKEKDVVKFDAGGKTYDFKRWFKIKDAAQFNSISTNLFNRTKVDKFEMFNTGNEIVISANNKVDKRNYYDDEIEGFEGFTDLKFEFGDDVFPLMNSLFGEAIFHIYTTTKGSIVIWVECNGLEWQITYKG